MRVGVVVLDLGMEQAEGGEQAGRGRHQHCPDRELARHAGGEERPVAAEGEQGVVTRVAAPLGRDSANGADHVRGGDTVGAERGVFRRQAHRLRHGALEGLARRLVVELQRAADEMARIEVSEQQVGVGEGWFRAARTVADGARIGACALRPHLQAARGVEAEQRAAAGADFREVDGRRLDHIARAGHQSGAGDHAGADTELERARNRAAFDDGRLGRRAAHVEGEDIVQAGGLWPEPARR